MIFLKNTKYEIEKREIKNSFPDDDVLVKYSISYPEINKSDGFSKVFNGFYSLMAKRFEDFSKNKLCKEAKRFRALTSENFVPFGAVLKFVCAFENKDVISIITDAFVSCGNGKQETKRLSQNWGIEKCRLLLHEDFFVQSQEKDIILGIKNEAKMRQETGLSNFFEGYEKKLKKGFSKNDFYLTPKGYGFFYPSGYLSQNNYADVFFLLGFLGEGEYDPYRKNRE